MAPLDLLKAVESLKDVPTEQLQWLLDEGQIVTYQEGDHLFKPGDPIDKLLILLEGNVVLKSKQGNQFRVIGNFVPGSISGYLPYSRADVANGYAQVMQEVRVLILPKSRFHDMITQQEELTTALVHVMSSRIRQFTKAQQQNDKMMALGKLSAGLAHELNNPSAAIVRSAQSLSSHLKLLPEGFKRVIKIDMTDEQVDAVNEMLFAKLEHPKPKLSMMERSSLEDDLLDWLEENEIDHAESLTDTLVTFGFHTDDLDDLTRYVKDKDLGPILNWLDQVLTTELLVSEIEEASGRINTLVTSVKSYTHMDQAPEKKLADLHEGIENTLNMLGHKLRKANISVEKDFDPDLAKPRILVSEMNQVWTNLIDNAIDAMEQADTRKLVIKTVQDKEFINVIIKDSGSGIPEDIQGQIFDPFFTTKDIGKGTGLGLEVVHQIVTTQHNGAITFESNTSGTAFKVCLPIT